MPDRLSLPPDRLRRSRRRSCARAALPLCDRMSWYFPGDFPATSANQHYLGALFANMILCRRSFVLPRLNAGLLSSAASLHAPRSVFELHTLLHSGPQTDPLAPGLQMLQPGIVGERFAASIDRV